ncbi:MAG: DUF3365 domain-containing protein, partial [Chloroflexi bacterium]|nr:DUF3365 domain-containing protein [Chloroflexota bacterium]
MPVTETTPPNPYLSRVPERDITTPSGVQLTLMNPAYILRQMSEVFADTDIVASRITSLDPLNPINAPDAWERAALQAFEDGQAEVAAFIEVDGEPSLRLMQPMLTREGCLNCHAVQGYQEGDIRGGISIQLPLTHVYQRQNQNILVQSSALGAL